jgi:hypothetical protein
MRTKTGVGILLVCLVTMAGIVHAEEKYGVIVYPGAKYDSGASEFLQQMAPKSAAYRTSDSLAKVIEFYRKQPGFKLVGEPTKDGALFRKGAMDITMQSPYMDTKTGKMIKDTLISIVTRSE